MHDALTMSVIEGIGDLDRVAKHFADGQRTGDESVGQGPPFQYSMTRKSSSP